MRPWFAAQVEEAREWFFLVLVQAEERLLAQVWVLVPWLLVLVVVVVLLLSVWWVEVALPVLLLMERWL